MYLFVFSFNVCNVFAKIQANLFLSFQQTVSSFATLSYSPCAPPHPRISAYVLRLYTLCVVVVVVCFPASNASHARHHPSTHKISLPFSFALFGALPVVSDGTMNRNRFGQCLAYIQISPTLTMSTSPPALKSTVDLYRDTPNSFPVDFAEPSTEWICYLHVSVFSEHSRVNTTHRFHNTQTSKFADALHADTAVKREQLEN